MHEEVGASAPPTVVTVERDIEGIAREWDGLAREAVTHPFMRPGWLAPWHAAFGSGPIEIFVARRSGQLVGVLPLERKHRALVALANWHTPEFEPVGVDEAACRALVAAAAQRAGSRLDLAFLPRSGSARALVGAEMDGRVRVITRTIERSPYVPLAGDWQSFESALSIKRRSDLRRRHRRLTELGELTIGPENEDLPRLLREGFEVEASGWKGERHTAIAEDPPARRFYELLADWAAKEGLLSLWFLRIDTRPIAFAFCITTGEAHYVLKIGFDADHARYAPGLVLTQGMLRAAFDAGLSSYEFLGAEEDYKLIWTDRCHERERLQLFGRGPRGRLEHAAWAYGRPLVKRMMRR